MMNDYVYGEKLANYRAFPAFNVSRETLLGQRTHTRDAGHGEQFDTAHDFRGPAIAVARGAGFPRIQFPGVRGKAVPGMKDIACHLFTGGPLVPVDGDPPIDRAVQAMKDIPRDVFAGESPMPPSGQAGASQALHNIQSDRSDRSDSSDLTNIAATFTQPQHNIIAAPPVGRAVQAMKDTPQYLDLAGIAFPSLSQQPLSPQPEEKLQKLLPQMHGASEETTRLLSSLSLVTTQHQSSLAWMSGGQGDPAMPSAAASPAFPPSAIRPELPQVAPAALPAAQPGVIQVHVLLGVDEQANLTAAVVGAAASCAQRVVQEMNWQQGALASAPM